MKDKYNKSSMPQDKCSKPAISQDKEWNIEKMNREKCQEKSQALTSQGRHDKPMNTHHNEHKEQNQWDRNNKSGKKK